MRLLALLVLGLTAISVPFINCTDGRRAELSTSQESLFLPPSQSPFAVGKEPTGLAVNDLNRDRKPDVITANTSSDSISILLGDGRGGFKSSLASPFKTRKAPAFVAIADLNNDNNLDVVVAPHDGGYDVVLLLGDGKGGLTVHPDSPLDPLKATDPHTHGLLLVDLNGDNYVDIVTANAGANREKPDNCISVLLGNRKGHFKLAQGSPFRLHRMPAAITVGDVNTDGKVDIVAVHEGTKDFSVLLGDGRGSFMAARPKLVLPTYGNSIAVADVNIDAKPDLIISHDNSSLLSILLGDGKGEFKFAPNSPIDVGQRGWDIINVDVDNDNRVDLVLRSENDTMMVLLGNGNAEFKPASGSPYSVGRAPRGHSVADMNGDGKPDLVIANSGSNSVTVLLGR